MAVAHGRTRESLPGPATYPPHVVGWPLTILRFDAHLFGEIADRPQQVHPL